ncbi:dihydroneopterin aldolase [Veillonella intestinalis]|uniref:dihydroneopterin aldolase n=1 Tax=Veillonella intestinalis TaxID=2941341 RepID=UPI00203B737D|nr:dihydroneopterin aldolase [Veillonella intestinalis]
MDKIVLKNMGFFGYHGHLDSETSQGQRFFVDVTVVTDLTKAGQSDLLEDSINYVEIYNTVERIVTGEPHKLLEKVGTLIADELWNNYRGIVGLAVAVRKPAVPIPGMLDYAEITITRGQM